MGVRLKPLDQQVIVITGGSSGIGLVTARMAAERGAKVVISSRNEQALREEADSLNAKRGDGREPAVSHFVADVADRDQVEALAQHAVDRFGRIDTWVNNAASALYGELIDIPIEDQRRLFDVNYWGTVYGTLAAIDRMTEGGAIINIGSILSAMPLPLQGAYTATKHAVKGFTDALRIELKARGMPIALSLIHPSATDTPYPDHARAYMEEAPTLPPPVYAPQLVARTILYAAQNDAREIYVGGAGRIMVALRSVAPALFDWTARKYAYDAQKADIPASALSARRDNLYEPRLDAERGRTNGWTLENSLYTEMQINDRLQAGMTGAALLGTGMALYALMPRRERSRRRERRGRERGWDRGLEEKTAPLAGRPQ